MFLVIMMYLSDISLSDVQRIFVYSKNDVNITMKQKNQNILF